MPEENTDKEKIVTELSLEVIAKSIIKEAGTMGFSRENYLKLINMLMDKALTDNTNDTNEENTSAIDYLDKNNIEFPLIGKNIKVRNINRKNDIPIIEKWLNDDEGRNFLLTRTTARNYTLLDLIEKETDLIGVISTFENAPIGLMAYLDIDRDQKKAELRKLIGEPAYRKRGFGKEATKLWINFGAGNLQLKKIYLNTLEANVRNIRLNRELGFHVEGIFKSECLIDGKYSDILRMGLILP